MKLCKKILLILFIYSSFALAKEANLSELKQISEELSEDNNALQNKIENIDKQIKELNKKVKEQDSKK